MKWSISPAHAPKAEKYLKKAIFLNNECSLIKKYSCILLIQGKYNESFNFLDSISSITPCEQICDMARFRIYATQKEFEKAEKCYNLSATAGYAPTYDDRLYLAYLYKETGRKREAKTILNDPMKQIEKLLEGNEDIFYISLFNVYLAAASALLDENSKALKYLSEVERSGPFEEYIRIKSFPGFDNLWSDPEFQSILNRIEDKKASLRAQVKEMEMSGELDL